MLAGQHWYYPRNDGPISYVSIARMLNAVSTRIGQAQRMHEESFCTAADPKAIAVTRRGGGLPPNSFICYNFDLVDKEYLSSCMSGSSSSSNGGSSSSGGSTNGGSSSSSNGGSSSSSNGGSSSSSNGGSSSNNDNNYNPNSIETSGAWLAMVQKEAWLITLLALSVLITV